MQCGWLQQACLIHALASCPSQPHNGAGSSLSHLLARLDSDGVKVRWPCTGTFQHPRHDIHARRQENRGGERKKVHPCVCLMGKACERRVSHRLQVGSRLQQCQISARRQTSVNPSRAQVASPLTH